MGMYTEFIFGCALKKDTPKVCIDALDYVINGRDKKPKYENPVDYEQKMYNEMFIERTTPIEEIEAFIEKYDFWRLFTSSSYYFGAAHPTKKLYWDDIDHTFKISTRADLKNYEHKIEDFVEYIRPYVDSGSGLRDIYAYVMFEESEFPTIYAVDGTYTMPKIEDEDDDRLM